jgi:tetratricopeptide (TPR) repeat protein
LKPDFANPYRHRGNSSRNLGQYEKAIKDFNEAIRLKPDYAEAYNDRGLTYILSGNKPEGCRSLVRACELGYCKDYELSKQKSDCK